MNIKKLEAIERNASKQADVEFLRLRPKRPLPRMYRELLDGGYQLAPDLMEALRGLYHV